MLPDDILVAIITKCDAVTIARCRRVNKAFNNLILTTSQLQLIIELYLSGMELGNSSLSVPELLSKLRLYNKAWDGLDFVDEPESSIDLPDFLFWHRDRHIIAFLEETDSRPSRVHVFQIPSALKGIEYKTWILDSFNFRAAELVIDALQDLLILVEIINK
jgi:hypothetical protein